MSLRCKAFYNLISRRKVHGPFFITAAGRAGSSKVSPGGSEQ